MKSVSITYNRIWLKKTHSCVSFLYAAPSGMFAAMQGEFCCAMEALAARAVNRAFSGGEITKIQLESLLDINENNKNK